MTPVEVLRAMAADLEAEGIPVHFVPGWESRGRPYAFTPQGLTCHHTATRGYNFDYPSLGIVRDGRSDLPGPLSQLGIGRHTGTVYVIAAGTANHAGPGGWKGLTGNTRVWGIEAENDGVGEAWGPEITRAYLATAAALCRHGGFGADMVHRHAEWSSHGKIDTATAPFNSGNWIRSTVAELISAGSQPTPELLEDDMRIINVKDRGIFLCRGDKAQHITHTDHVKELVAAGVPYEAKAEVSAGVFDQYLASGKG